jgi:cytoskeletal protein RodZ
MSSVAARTIVLLAVFVLAITGILVATVFQKSLLPPAHQEIKIVRDANTDRQHSVSNNVTDAVQNASTNTTTATTATSTAPGKVSLAVIHMTI